ncbi:MAG TPA: hypothetical protein VG124_15220 [Beijerinckiaceae bacterium]|jgi:hypothetical protein|nr:hypothetical protein [Beijerinckiaceae bacterium]
MPLWLVNRIIIEVRLVIVRPLTETWRIYASMRWKFFGGLNSSMKTVAKVWSLGGLTRKLPEILAWFEKKSKVAIFQIKLPIKSAPSAAVAL